MQTTHCSSTIAEAAKNFGLKKIENETYVKIDDGSIWKERPLLDLGWGKENGFYRVPLLPKEKLLELVIDFDKRIIKRGGDDILNFFGALAILMEDYGEYLINEIEYRISSHNFSLDGNKRLIQYMNSEFHYDAKFLKKVSDKNYVECCELWKSVKERINLC